jgi:hypothetical protein
VELSIGLHWAVYFLYSNQSLTLYRKQWPGEALERPTRSWLTIWNVSKVLP